LSDTLAGIYSCSSLNAGPQHDQLASRCRQLNIQEFQTLSHTLYGLWKKGDKPGAGRQAMARVFAVANFRRLLAEEVVLKGGQLLAASPDLAPNTLERQIAGTLARTLKLSERTLAALPASFPRDLQEGIARGLALVRDAARAEPPGDLFFPQQGLAPAGQGARFDPTCHEPLPGCPCAGDLCIRFTVFPGYRVGRDGIVLEKALVYTESPEDVT
jgi:hypothetical protein